MDITQELRNYQLYYLLPSSLTEEDCGRTREELMKILQEQGARITQSPDLSKKKLAYPVARQTFAYAGKIIFLAQPNVIPVLNSSLRQEEGLLRFAFMKKSAAEPFIERNEESFAQDRRRKYENKKEFGSYGANAPHQNNAAPDRKSQGQEEMPRKDQEKITIEDIDRKLDEIMKNIQ